MRSRPTSSGTDGPSRGVAGPTLLVRAADVLVDGAQVRIPPAPLAVPHALLVNPGHVVSRRDLLAALPPGTAGSEHALETAVARLRVAVGARIVQTVVTRGYRLVVTS